MVLSFPFRPTPSHRLSLVCLLELIPRPRAREERASGRFADAGERSVCLLPIMSCRSLAPARSLLLFGSPVGCLLGLPRAVRFASVPRSPVFF